MQTAMKNISATDSVAHELRRAWRSSLDAYPLWSWPFDTLDVSKGSWHFATRYWARSVASGPLRVSVLKRLEDEVETGSTTYRALRGDLVTPAHQRMERVAHSLREKHPRWRLDAALRGRRRGRDQNRCWAAPPDHMKVRVAQRNPDSGHELQDCRSPPFVTYVSGHVPSPSHKPRWGTCFRIDHPFRRRTH